MHSNKLLCRNNIQWDRMIHEDVEHVTSTNALKEKDNNQLFAEEFIDSKERLSDIINFLPDATFVIDSAGRVIAWNRAMEKMTHVNADKMLGKGKYEYSIPFYGKRRKMLIDLALSSTPEIEKEYSLLWRGKRSVTGEIFIPSLEGRPAYLWGKATTLFNKKGIAVGAIESIRDISLQKKAEMELKKYRVHLEELVDERTEELNKTNKRLRIEVQKRVEIDRKLKRSEKNYRSIFKHAGIGIFQCTPTGEFTNVNITMAHMLGYGSPEEMISSIHLDQASSPKANYGFEIISKIKDGKGIIKFENEFIRKNGDRLIAELNMRVVRDENNTPIYFEGFAQDITSRKKTERALKESEDKYRTIFENTGAATLLIEEDTTISLINTEFEKLSGYSHDEVEGKSWTEFIYESDLKKMLDYNDLRYRYPNLAPNNYEFQFLKKDKSIGYAYMNIEKIPGTTQLIASILDVTERKNNEKKLYKLNEKLKHSNKELEQFAYVASHDLREPLRMITSFLELLKKGYVDQLDNQATTYIKYAVEGAEHLDALINDLLEYARLGQKNLEFNKVNCEKLLNDTIINLKSLIDENSAVITYDNLPSVNGNENLLIELFQNLIDNSIKYKGIEPPKIHVSAHEEENKYIFSVSDNGMGMSKKDLERIFVIFQRLHTRDEYEGTGIGLAIAQKIVDQHGGKIWAESEPEKGTTFYFSIPA